MVSILYIVGLATLAVFANADSDYCSIETCAPGTQTLCQHSPEKTNSQQCTDLESSSLTQEEIQEILDAHNDMRAYVASGQETRGNPGPQPAATNLGDLEWDEELANVAQAWANQCLLHTHETCGDVERFGVNQNLAEGGSTASYEAYSWSDLVQQWYDEVDKFDASNVNELTMEGTKGTLHYTQLMWADTKYVGCGGVRFMSGQYKMNYLVCEYGPGGNYVGLPLYETA